MCRFGNMQSRAVLMRLYVTLVFPFESDITTEALLQDLKVSTVGLKPFQIVLRGITGAGGVVDCPMVTGLTGGFNKQNTMGEFNEYLCSHVQHVIKLRIA